MGDVTYLGKRKYKVFISSSFEDLKDERHSLLLRTLKLGHIPAGMELFQPGEPRNLDVIEKDIATSDIFVVLVGARLGGFVSDEDSLTFTMAEFDMAKKYRLPIVPFLLDPNDFDDERKKLTSNGKPDKDQQTILLRQFRENVQKRPEGGKRLTGFFSYGNTDKLCDDYADAIRSTADALAEAGARGGWVSGKFYDELTTRIMLGEAVSTNPFFQRFANRLSTYGKLSDRIQIQAALKAGIAEYFWDQYMARIDEKRISHIYFESGSSIAYVSRTFIEYVKEEDWFYEHSLHKRLRIRTNNLLTYLDFLLVDAPWRPMDVQLQPHGLFSSDYGATYGYLKSARKLNFPSTPEQRRGLEEDADKIVREFTRQLAASGFAKSGLVLMTASGVDIEPTSAFPGPHVGSYYNMLLKRCLLSLQCPKVMFLDDTKWGLSLVLNSCHSVCDTGFMWDKLKADSALAIGLAASDRDSRDEIGRSLANNGFPHQECGAVKSGIKGVWPIIAANEAFRVYFSKPTADGRD